MYLGATIIPLQHGAAKGLKMEEKKPRGRPALPPEMGQTALIRERVTPAQRAEYEARGGKAWLVQALARKPRQKKGGEA